MKKTLKFSKTKKSKAPTVPAQMDAQTFRTLTSVISKQFINGDPNFFIPSYRIDDAKDTLTNPYANNVWVYAAVSAITTNLIVVPKVLDIKATEEKEAIDIHPALDVLDNPNHLMDGPAFWENIILNLMLPTKTTKGGQCFIFAESLTNKPVNLQAGEIPKELYPFSDEFVTAIIDKKDNITLLGWRFQPDPTKPPIIYMPEEVIRIYLVDPKSPLTGQCPLWAARAGMRQDVKAQTLNERFFDNNASLGGVLETDAEMNPDAGKEVLDSFQEKYSGQNNAGRVALLHSGIKYQMFQQSHVDMQFLDQRKWNREEVLAAYGVPKFNIGVYEDINFATAKAADKAFWQNTLVPLDKRILRAFSKQWICNIPPETLRLASDYTDVQALLPDFTEKLEQAKKLWEMHVPVEEINNRLDLQLDVSKYEWLQTALIQGSLKPAEQLFIEPESIDDADLEPTSANPNDEESTNTGHTDDEEDTLPEPVEEAMRRIGKLAKKAEAIESLKKTYASEILIPDEKRFNKLINNYLREQRNLILDEVDKWESANKALKAGEDTPKPDPKKLTNFKREENKRLMKTVTPAYIKMAMKEAEVLSVELAGVGEWTITSPGMKKILRERLKQVRAINNTSFKLAQDGIGRAIAKATKEGLGVQATTKLVKKEINLVYTKRINAKTIAVTESNSIHSQTRMDIYKTNGITKIKWNTSGLDNVRSEEDSEFPHTILDGVVATIKEGFDNGEHIRFPLDPSASPGNVINCNCFVTSEA